MKCAKLILVSFNPMFSLILLFVLLKGNCYIHKTVQIHCVVEIRTIIELKMMS